MKKPNRQRPRPARRGPSLALATAGLVFGSNAALAQTPGCSLTSSNGAYTCTIPSGSYNQAYDGRIYTSSPLTFTNNGTLNVVTQQSANFLGALQSIVNGSNGGNSSSDDAGSGSPGGNITFTNNGIITHGISTLLSYPNVANTVYGGSFGGNGGNYTDDNAKHDGGSAAAAGSAMLTNIAAIQVSGSGSTGTPSTIISGAALLVDSLGGHGGSVTSTGPDHNGNPQYHSANGTAGAGGGNATLINSGQVNASFGAPLVSAGYWGVAARSLGGNGGTGNDGTAGGGAGAASVTNTANVNVNIAWGATISNAPSFPATPGAFAVHARSQGGNGNMSVNSGNNGGTGGTAGASSVTVGLAGTPVSITLGTQNPSGLTITPLSAAIGAISLGGNGGAGYDKSTGGQGGLAGAVSVTILDSVTVRASGDRTLGILGLAQGGNGGNSGVGQDNSTAGNGGGTGYYTNTNLAVNLGLTNTFVTTSGAQSPGVMAASLGGAGGTGLTYTESLDPDAKGGTAGGGGNTGPIQIQITGGSIATTGAQSPGVEAIAQGGLGGRGGDVNALGGYSGNGGTGGQGAPVTVTILGGTVITTSGGPSSTNTNPAFGVYAASIGGAGGQGGDLNVDTGGGKGNGGYGGGAYDVNVTLLQGARVATSGAGASAVAAFSLGGTGGSASPNSTAGFVSTNGNGGAGGSSGTVTVSNGAALTTSGTSAHGILAQSIGGISGNGGDGAGVIYGPGGDAGTSGTTGAVNVINTGAISTSGSSAFGIQAQSIGGGSGAGGSDTGSFISFGGSATAAANGGAASVRHLGSITTRGDYALGILTQSVGGGGGNAGDANGVFGSVGGAGGGGGVGSTATVTLNGGSITTSGRLAHALVAQSIGGGGGNAGDASSAGTVVTLAIGGTAGAGGAGGPVTLNATSGSIGTSGSNAMGLVAQSIGGGGGTGGSAYTVTAGTAFSAAVAIGGSGGSGGGGGSATLNLAGLTISTGQATAANTNLNPVDAYGIVAQSLGGGGGIGGSASALALTVGIPLPGTDGSTVSGSVASAVGGSGATGGSASSVSLTLNGGSNITTQGQGSHALLLQSVGGGGGAGGDSSAMATTISYGRATTAASSNGFSGEVSVAVGGSGQNGGAGGSVTANIDATTIITLGDYANGLVAQSVGGGGGNGGVGSTTTLAFGSTRDLHLAIGVGGKGGTGGTGLGVSVTIGPQAVIQTYGASALGVVAQSIGGGGGTSQGGTINLGGAFAIGSGGTVTPSANSTLSVGATGGSGGNGGTITAVMQGQIRTSGSDAAGVVMQSIGGGGGIGGSAGSEASSDNPIQLATKLRTAISDAVESNMPIGFSSSVSVGGRGGTAGYGVGIDYSQAGSITTQGDWSHGLVAQSIGGGGGMGGVAASGSSQLGMSTNIALGGGGGAGGNGGSVSLTFGTGASISTGLVTSGGVTGYGAFGVLAQSIGGGGGTGVDGSTASVISLNLGATGSGSGGSAGNGSTVTINGTANIVTRGDVAVGMLLQSIGGGGGLGGTGNAVSAGVGRFTGTTQLQVGGTNGASGYGETVNINNATLNIQTSGAHAYGILAQSIGGGGGFAFSPNLTDTVVNAVGARVGTSAIANNGGAVQLNLVGGGIQTSGLGAHGIIAQSIGGGGGIAGLPTGPASMTTLAYRSYSGGSTPSGSGNEVTIVSSTPITTTGDFAYGILAQSIGGGGGLFAQGTQVFAGLTNSGVGSVTPSGYGGEVSVRQTAPIIVSGANSVGIFIQSVGVNAGASVAAYISAAVQGGSGAQGYGIWADSTSTASNINIDPTGSVSALSGQAILMTAGNVYNQGTVTGSYSLGNGGTFVNTGTLNAGSSLVAGQLLNTGNILIGALAPYDVSRVSGNFVQQASGRLLLDADFGNRRSDVMLVEGSADLAGRVRPLISSVLPNIELPFLTVNGAVSGSVAGENSTLFQYQVGRKGGTFSVSASGADFTPAGYNLARNHAATAGHMQAAWDGGGNTALGPLFALLGNTADAGGVVAYRAALRQLSPDSSLAPGARVAAGAQAFAQAAMSCPQFQGTTAMLVEGECVWARLTGRTAAQAGSDGLSSFRINSTTWQAGGQWALGGGWFLGGSVAYENSRLSAGDGLRGGRGDAGFGAVTAKYQTGSWLFAGAVFGGGGQFNATRTITLPGFGAIARGSPTLSNVGTMLRGSYTIGREEFYLRPSMSLSLVQARSGEYRESGAGALNLDVSGASSTVGAMTPALEVGGRATLSNGVVMRLFTSAGVSFLSQDRWSQRSRLTSAPASAGSFPTTLRTDQVVGRVAAGVQLFATDRLELRLQYDGEYSSNLTGHGGSLSVAMRF